MRTVETDVLIVGAGPAGLTASALLARSGVDAVTVTKYPATAHTPRAHITNQRAMEIYRDLGIEDRVRAVATPGELMGDNVWATSFAGQELARMKAWGTRVDRKADYEAASPCTMSNVGQHLLEPLILESARENGADIRFGHELLDITQDEDAVYGTVLDRAAGETYRVKAGYALGTDGGRSTVAERLGFSLEGETGLGHAVNVWLEADLTRYREHRPGTLFFTVQPGKDFWLGAGTYICLKPWTEWVLIVVYDPAVEQLDLSEEAMLARVHATIGDPSVEVRIKDISQWQMNHVLAREYRKGRVFLAGDAAHRHPPANGLGTNTSVQDSYNLAWKIALAVRGKAGDGLLDSYHTERHPVGRQVVDRALKSVGLAAGIPSALGVRAGQSDEEGKAALAEFFSDSEQGREHRRKLEAILRENDYHFNAHGVELGQRYASSAVVPDGTTEPAYLRDPELFHQPTTHPGASLPHAWLEHAGERISTLDLAGHGDFALLTGIGGEPWLAAAEQVSSELGVEIVPRPVGYRLAYDDVYGDWSRLREVDDRGCLLVRPDRHIAWRSQDMTDDPAQTLRHVMRQLLGLG
ncbi:FAD-dependent monooxygenase [Streptomyces sp. NBC_00690]|uniref:FAD-dependent monooxygenase n=1 Tax=Streptomyces sp. NBC_00690 TaxID=2975808 RepID=UPI002E2CAE89|nr:FAD-dependent monooxygenase [Streptomyces sp. NBC_00690]